MARRLKALEDENGRLTRMLADAMLDNVALKEFLVKVVPPAAHREVAVDLRSAHEMTSRGRARCLGVDRSSVHYHLTRPLDWELRERLKALAQKQRRFGD